MTAEKAAELCRYIDVETWRITYIHQHIRSYIYLLSVSNDIMLYSITVGAQTEGFFNIYIYIYIYIHCSLLILMRHIHRHIQYSKTDFIPETPANTLIN